MAWLEHRGHGTIKTVLDAVAVATASRPKWRASQSLIDDLRNDARKTEVSPQAHTAWDEYCRQVRDNILNEDPSDFLRWKGIRRAMCLTNHLYLRSALATLKALPDWQARWRPALREPWIGNPVPFLFDTEFVGNSIHLAYHIARWEQWSGRRISDVANIVEFGAGYGSMARLVHALGFTGRYVLYDLPQFSALQRFYLNACGMAGKFETVNDLNELRRITSEFASERLFIANISLSETPLAVREPIRALVREWEHLLITYQVRFHEIDNIEYFSTWRSDNHESTVFPIPHFADCYYLLSRSNVPRR